MEEPFAPDFYIDRQGHIIPDNHQHHARTGRVKGLWCYECERAYTPSDLEKVEASRN